MVQRPQKDYNIQKSLEKRDMDRLIPPAQEKNQDKRFERVKEGFLGVLERVLFCFVFVFVF